jgi:hypothetical protein
MDKDIRFARLPGENPNKLLGRRVGKCGAKTGIRTGTVCDGFVKGTSMRQMYQHYDLTNIDSKQVYYVPAVAGRKFASRGDSGAWVVDSTFSVVGTIFGGESHGEEGEEEVTYFTPLSAIIEDIEHRDPNMLGLEIFRDL